MASCLHSFNDHQKISNSSENNHQDVDHFLRPLVEAYKLAVYERRYDDVKKFYHPNAVLVESQEKCYHKPQAIIEAISAYRDPMHPVKTTTTNESFSGSGDVFSYRNEWLLESENEILSGPFVQIWLRQGDSFVLYHEEFSISKRSPKK